MEKSLSKTAENKSQNNDFVLDKGIFSNIFEKDIRRVYIYKKAERLAKAIHLISPAFRNSVALRNRTDQVAIGLIDAAILPPQEARDALSKELLALSSVLSIARTGGLLSSMNAELIAREAQQLLQEIATYEEPRLFFDDAPSLAVLAREAAQERNDQQGTRPERRMPERPHTGQIKDSGVIRDKNSNRKAAIRSVLEKKGPSYIKDISTVIRDVSEKTIQRELQHMIDAGEIAKSGERRWTMYSIV